MFVSFTEPFERQTVQRRVGDQKSTAMKDLLLLVGNQVAEKFLYIIGSLHLLIIYHGLNITSNISVIYEPKCCA
jgi:hypothetical protein